LLTASRSVDLPDASSTAVNPTLATSRVTDTGRETAPEVPNLTRPTHRPIAHKQMTRKRFLAAGGAVLGLLTIAPHSALAVRETQRPHDRLEPVVALGAFNEGDILWGDTSPVDEYTSLVGAPPLIINVFHPFKWESTYVSLEADYLNRVQSRFPKSVIMVTWEPNATRSAPLHSIIEGTHDVYVRSCAQEIKAFGKRILIRFAHEMNGTWYAWCGNPAKYKDAWNKMRLLFAAEGAADAEWVWCPSIEAPSYSASYPMAAYYPGDSSVEWLGLDGYNWATSHGDPWFTFDELMRPNIDSLESISSTKRVIIGETGCHDGGGNKALWIQQMHQSLRAHTYPSIAGVCYFNSNKDGANWRVDTSAESLAAYSEMVQDPYMQASLPAGM
jgi:hypothetical protein